jgi:peptidylprolyl isomerase
LLHIDAQLCPQRPSTLTPPRSSHHPRYPPTQASLSPSHAAERASIVKTVFDRIAGASLAIAATVAIATSPANAIQMGLPEEEVTKLICDAACETTINDAELVTTQSGLQYRDIKVGDGVQPEIGFQVGKFILILV